MRNAEDDDCCLKYIKKKRERTIIHVDCRFRSGLFDIYKQTKQN